MSCMLILVLFTGVALSQTAPVGPADSEKEVNGTAPKKETPKKIVNIELKDNMLTAELVDADFGEVMEAIAKKAGFRLLVQESVYKRKVNTRLRDMELERAVLRLLTLINEKNYLLDYDNKGAISKVEVYGATQAEAPAKTEAPRKALLKEPARPVTPSAPARGVQKNPPPTRRIILPPSQKKQEPQPKAEQEAPDAPAELTGDEPPGIEKPGDNGGGEESVPYIPPKKKPVFIPSRRFE